MLSLTLPEALGAFLPLPHRLSGAPSIPPMPTQGSAARHRGWDELCQRFLPARFWAVRNTPDEATDAVPVSHRREISLTCGSGTSPRLLPPPPVLPMQITAR